MVRTYQEVPKRAKNSITIQVEKLVKKYGEKSVRLVAMRLFDKASKQRKLEEAIKKTEAELKKLREKK